MVYFCADDYGISKASNRRIEKCLEKGILNKVSILANGDITDFKERLTSRNAVICLHLNLVEGHPLSDPAEVKLLLAEDGTFRHSFGGLLLRTFSPRRKEIERELYREIRSQIRFWKTHMGDEPLSIDGHQHAYMIPYVFRVMMQVIADEEVNVRYMRFPAEPFSPYLLTPSLYLSYSVTGLAKQWLLKFFAHINHRRLRKTQIKPTFFMGAMFSGKLTEEKVKKLLPKYLRLAEKHDRHVEIGFHPGYFEEGEVPMAGYRKDFEHFYFSPWRKREYETLINFEAASIEAASI